MKKIKIFIANTKRKLIKSTDDNYIRNIFPLLHRDFNLEFIFNDNITNSFYAEGLLIINYLANKINYNKLIISPYLNTLICSQKINADIIFAYGVFPLTKHKLPLICEQTYAPANRNINIQDWIERIRITRHLMVERSTALVTPSMESYKVFLEAFPQYHYKINYIPYYLPYLTPITFSELQRKYDDLSKIKLLFVGKQAIRKGLDIFIEAYQALATEYKNKFNVTIVSNLLDGPIKIPDEFKHYNFVDDILKEFDNTHLLVFPTKHEAYGLVIVEALARGCNIITSNAPIQKTILNNEGGWFINPYSSSQLKNSLIEIINNKEILLANAKKNLNNFLNDKSPLVVGKKYYNLFSMYCD